ncbi:hypothetical protein B0A48_14401 [Cryoendolithus antarcticus]|uniref:Uncharacterized protein n=1 Tax=Cryoendolithus antarcticus TaxID=1507870 RepID=A0A1V8SJT0_9PEZI|nr:hypothetical protein B0A48_14401 [Cryoendolithus antarcticus]
MNSTIGKWANILPCTANQYKKVDLDWWCPDDGNDATWCSGPVVKYGSLGGIEMIAPGINPAIENASSTLLPASMSTTTVTATPTIIIQSGQTTSETAGYVPKRLAIEPGAGLDAALLALLAITSASMVIVAKEKRNRIAAEAQCTLSRDRTSQIVQAMQQMESAPRNAYKAAPILSEVHGSDLAAELSDYGHRGELP